jgi:hypothetical protein
MNTVLVAFNKLGRLLKRGTLRFFLRRHNARPAGVPE